MADYKPGPINTDGIELDNQLQEIVEQLARNSHENWAAQRLKDGWTYGAERDDERKQHPCLIPYEELEESEKKYDRVLAEEVIKALLALGYTIKRKE